ncbi:uncharacterized protein trim33l isoform X2 [Betta splendens]|uniref:Uncharacterized protein trim33l isoform X2 n=2 Tax=Betta splendens TaxID=158456 RepID=A0A9W2XBM7_BETSP|nr:uncharacterized protein trim33l isoform X2 [Betta splendens]
MNHRYEFVSEALDGLKKQLEDQVDPIRARRDTMKRTLQDMETRVKDIVQNESCLKVQLHQSYDAFLQHLQKRKENLIEEIQKVHQSELDWIHMRMAQMRELHKSLQAVTDAADDAKSTNDLMSLQTYRAQIESQLKNLPGLNLPLPKLIPQMKVVTDSNSLMTVLNFGNLEISWVPFSVSSPQDPDPPDTCSVLSPTTITGLQSTHGLQTETSNDSGLAAPVQSTAASSSGHQCPPTCSSFVPSSTSTSASTAGSPSSASRPPLQTVSCSSGAPANLPPPGQLWLLPPSSVLTGFSSAAPPSSTCAKHQTTGLNATTEQCWDTHLSSLQKYVNKKPLPPRSFDSSMSLFTVTQPDSKAVCQTGTSNSVLLSSAAPSSSSLCSTSGSFSISSPFIPAQPISTLQPNQSSSLNSPQSVPVGSHQPPSPSQNQPAVILLYRSTLLPPLPQPSRRGYTVTVQAAPVLSSAVTVPSVTAENQIFVGPSPKAQSNQTVVELSPQPVPSGPASSPQPVPSGREPHPQPIPSGPEPHPVPSGPASSPQPVPSGPASSPQPVPSGPEPHPQPIPSGPEPHPVPSGPASSPQPVPSDFTPDSSSLEHEDLSHVVKAVADSACDHGMQQVEMKRQEPAENEPTSTMCEETEPLQSRSETADSDSEDPSGPGQQDSRLSQWQPKVCLFRLPLPPPPPGCPLPTYRLARGFAKDGIYLEEMRDNCESHANESTPESPVTLQLVSCSACGCADGSIICFSCGRGYHRDCHLPPVGPDFCS